MNRSPYTKNSRASGSSTISGTRGRSTKSPVRPEISASKELKQRADRARSSSPSRGSSPTRPSVKASEDLKHYIEDEETDRCPMPVRGRTSRSTRRVGRSHIIRDVEGERVEGTLPERLTGRSYTSANLVDHVASKPAPIPGRSPVRSYASTNLAERRGSSPQGSAVRTPGRSPVRSYASTDLAGRVTRDPFGSPTRTPGRSPVRSYASTNLAERRGSSPQGSSAPLPVRSPVRSYASTNLAERKSRSPQGHAVPIPGRSPVRSNASTNLANHVTRDPFETSAQSRVSGRRQTSRSGTRGRSPVSRRLFPADDDLSLDELRTSVRTPSRRFNSADVASSSYSSGRTPSPSRSNRLPSSPSRGSRGTLIDLDDDFDEIQEL